MRNLFAVGFGLLPLWLAIGFIAYGYQTMPTNDASMLLWALALAIPASVGTTVIALTTNAIYFDRRGSKTKRASIAALFFFAATAGLVLYLTRHIRNN